MAGCWAAAAEPMTWGDDTLLVLPGTLAAGSLIERLRTTDAAVIMKLGRNFAKVRLAVQEAGLLRRAIYVERGTMENESSCRLAEKADDNGAVFLADPDPRRGTAAVTGRLVIVGLGPGPAKWIAPEASAALEAATDIVGYQPYLDRVPQRPGQQRHGSDNRVELNRAREALAMAAEGSRVAVVSGGDPGVFGDGRRGVRSDRDGRTIVAHARRRGRSRHLGDAGRRRSARRPAGT